MWFSELLFAGVGRCGALHSMVRYYTVWSGELLFPQWGIVEHCVAMRYEVLWTVGEVWSCEVLLAVMFRSLEEWTGAK
jgi:hypothetical protein